MAAGQGQADFGRRRLETDARQGGRRRSGRLFPQVCRRPPEARRGTGQANMFPYQDTVATRFPPVIVWALVANVLIFLYQSSLPLAALEAFLFDYALVPSRFFGDLRLVAPAPDWLPFISNMFLHAGWLHLILNMWTLWISGRPGGRPAGSRCGFLGFYLACGDRGLFAAHAAFLSPQLRGAGARRLWAIPGVIGCLYADVSLREARHHRPDHLHPALLRDLGNRLCRRSGLPDADRSRPYRARSGDRHRRRGLVGAHRRLRRRSGCWRRSCGGPCAAFTGRSIPTRGFYGFSAQKRT